MIYFLVTTCIFLEGPVDHDRRGEYIHGITRLKQVIRNLNIYPCKIILLENNGARKTYLDHLECDVFYTNNKSLPTKNKGFKELRDVLDCIQYYHIQDNDFIVKMTGRYLLAEDSEFMKVMQRHSILKYDCVLRYGSYINLERKTKDRDCITGLIGMRCLYVKQIQLPSEVECIEHKWAEASFFVKDDKLCILDKLGIQIRPVGYVYSFEV